MNSSHTNMLVIGGSGMLGQPVARQLAGDGFAVTVMSTNPDRARQALGDEFRVVYGDVTLPETLRAPLEGQGCVYINLNSKLDERRYHEVEIGGTANVARIAREMGVGRIGLISSATSHGEETGIIYVDAKVCAEHAVQESGIPYLVMRPSWFYESLPMFVRGTRAVVIGKHPLTRNWLSAADFARQVSQAFQGADTINKCYYNYGPERLTIMQALVRYCTAVHPNITPTSMSYMLARLASLAPGMSMLRKAIPFFKFFETSAENDDPSETDRLLGKNSQTLESWAETQR